MSLNITMKCLLYRCEEPGVITEEEIPGSAQFATAKKYRVLYAEELPRFLKQPLNIYALPFHPEPERMYCGTDRTGLHFFDKQKWRLSREQKALSKRLTEDFDFANELMKTETTALQYLSLYKSCEDYELIWVRIHGTEGEIPEGYSFAGYDVSYYPCESWGAFSMINDCLFICRWHGCDMEGKLFLEDFHKLNQNGLFENWQDAYDYMLKYLKEDWTEKGEYCIFEIYRRPDPQ
ncbi:MAG: hypothetical protein IKM59_05755 [Oscillospiraceae bacterium]|nr:hypothetical protein [Oscillospiraceae bacterium]